jgi:hypothetical protein
MSDTITERQGDKIIEVLGRILWELEKMNTEIGYLQGDVGQIDTKLSSMKRTLDNIESQG